ncbi:iron complex transport system substrate-binding protein [Pontibacter ummariensis]|uniref:Iron complex transport system substrate-binding protein n=1 Tax=Pontibacter ummariensis TaxID=1610492 RepID=A0A239KXF8_9BACT|nr:helical backbone metal receptor [Pontibacter ummariensis]PRY04934.1 iron complex transport system substrate-binding protein [Pontibacter ummariensis]SNT22422.1 iron complex transport system substrate-binding protein [Pontibacter ummariensis]
MLWLLSLTLISTLWACTQEKQETEDVILLQDDLGRELTLESQPKRVLSLSSSMTEMLFAVLDTSAIIGRTQNDDYPTAALAKPVVNNYPVDYEQVLALKPDLIFTIEGITPLDVAARLEELGIPVYYQKYNTVEDIFTGLEDIGRIMGKEQQATQIADSLRQEVAQIARRHKGEQDPQQVLAITWTDPIYVYGQNTILTDKLRILGTENAVKEVFEQPYPALTREYILKLNPDVLLGGTPEKLEESFFGQYPELRKIKAYQNKRLYAPTDDLMARPGPRVVESLRELEGFLYP